MSISVTVTGPAGLQEFTAADLPLTVGSGPDTQIRLPGPVSQGACAQIGALDGRLFVQPLPGQSVTVNGEAVAGTRWLEDADEIDAGSSTVVVSLTAAHWRFTISGDSHEHSTIPPDLAVAEGERVEPVARRRAEPVAAPVQQKNRVTRYGFWAALTVLVAVAAFLFAARSVRINVEPSTARIDIRGGLLTPRLDDRYLLLPGEYRAALSADGYVAAEQAFTVDSEPRQQFDYVLAKLPGDITISVAADPNVGAEARVWLDDKELGQAPVTATGITAGPHALRIEAERYLPFAETIDVVGLGQRQDYVAELEPAWADVRVVTEPPGASLSVGDDELGVSPATVPVLAGSRELLVQLDGYKLHRQLLTVEAGEVVELEPVVLKEADGILTVVTRPAGAAVSVDGRYRGNTPVEAELRPDRTYKVIVSKPGFASVTRSVTLESRQGRTLQLQLEARSGEVTVRATPADAELLIDGRSRGEVGEAGQTLNLPARPHTIELRKPGFALASQTVTPKPGLPQELDITLLTESQAVLAQTPSTVATGQGLELVLIRAGEFQMGTSRREQGRRANESQRSVRLTHDFYLARREITNSEYREFRPTHTSGAERYRGLGIGDHPAVLVSWDDAVTFCNWLSDRDGLPPAYVADGGRFVLASPRTTGYRLPTEAEWAWAARHNGGGETRKYGWGNKMPPTARSGNFADLSADAFVANVLSNYDDGFPVTAPVQRFRASPLGLYDLAGNVAEWTYDKYAVYPNNSAVVVDPTGPDAGQYHVIRGSGWRHASISELRLAYRDFGQQGRLDVGFRIARDADAAD